MRKFTFMLSLLALTWAAPVSAQVQSPYDVHLDDSVSTVMHEFKLAKGWAHVVDKSDNNRYVEYAWTRGEGVDASGCMKIGSQVFRDSWGDSQELHDLLVTPAVTGKATIKVRAAKRNGTIEFYRVKLVGGEYRRGEEIDVEAQTLKTDEYVVVEIADLNNERFGIRGENVYIDDFHADQVNIELRKTLSFATFRPHNLTVVDADATNRFPLEFDVSVINTGDEDIQVGDAGYKLYVITDTAFRKKLPVDTLFTLAIDEPLAVGATSQVYKLTLSVDATKYPDRTRYDVYEGISGKKKEGSWVDPVLYETIFGLRDGTNSALRYADGDTVRFGLTNKDVTKSLTVMNDGAAPLIISQVTASEGFRVDTELPLTVGAHETKPLSVTMLNSGLEEKKGELTIHATDTIVRLKLEGSLVPAGKWYVDFEEGKMPASFLIEKNTNWIVSDYTKRLNITANNYCAEAERVDSVKLVSPLLEVRAGDKLVFAAARHYDQSFVNVYYSADRRHWTKVRSLNTTTTNEADRLSDKSLGGYMQNAQYVFTDFTVDNIPAGRWYVAFESGYARIDNILGYAVVPVTHDVAVSEAILPTAATVNNEMQATATLNNLSEQSESGNNYKAKLYLGGEVVEELPGQDLAQGEKATFVFKTTPYAAGTFEAVIKFEGTDFNVATDTVQLIVSAEKASKLKQVGTPTSTQGQNAPLNLYYKNSESESIYTPAQLGIPAGTKILKLIYRGSATKDLKTNLKIWLQNTDDTGYANPIAATAPEQMTAVYDGVYEVKQGGSATEPADILAVDLQQPFEYTGKNLRIHVLANSNEYVTSRFEFDGSIPSSQSIHRKSDGTLGKYETVSTPVVYFRVQAQPKNVSGKITDGNGAALKDIRIEAVSDNVRYGATTDAAGHYTFDVYQDERAYDLRIRKVGYTPYQEHITFTADTVRNIVLRPAKALYIEKAELPARAVTNHEYQARITLYNPLAAAVTPTDYTAVLYAGTDSVAKAPAVTIQSGQTLDLAISYYPHKADTTPSYILLQSGDSRASTDTVQVVVAEEKATEQKVVGTPNSTAQAPVASYYKHSEAQIIYTAQQLDLKQGAPISSIVFKGLSSGATIHGNLRVYMENTDDTFDNGFVQRDTTEMEKVSEQTIELSGGGTYNDPVDKLVIDLARNFIYSGSNIRMVVAFDTESFHSVNFITDKTCDKNCYTRRSDNNVSTERWSKNYMPVAYLSIVVSKHLAGKVTDRQSGQPIAGAKVTLVSGNIEYSATTDADGAYDVAVIQTDLPYKASYKAEGFESESIDIAFATDDIHRDVTLKKSTATGIADLTEPTAKTVQGIYTIDGQKLNKPQRGINIIRYSDGSTRKVILP